MPRRRPKPRKKRLWRASASHSYDWVHHEGTIGMGRSGWDDRDGTIGMGRSGWDDRDGTIGLTTKYTKYTKKQKKVEDRRRDMADLIYREESYNIMGACFEVYKHMGCGFLEAVYQECLEIEFTERGIPFVPQRQLPILYKDRILEQYYMADFVCYEKIVLEVKAVTQLTDEHRAQVLNYLRATSMRLGLLINFKSYPKIEYERIVL